MKVLVSWLPKLTFLMIVDSKAAPLLGFVRARREMSGRGEMFGNGGCLHGRSGSPEGRRLRWMGHNRAGQKFFLPEISHGLIARGSWNRRVKYLQTIARSRTLFAYFSLPLFSGKKKPG